MKDQATDTGLGFETYFESKKISLQRVYGAECIHYLPWLKLIPYVNQDHWAVLGHCLTGFLSMYIGYVEDNSVGLIVLREEIQGEITVYAIYVPDYLHLFKQPFFRMCKTEGYKRIHFVSSLPERAAKKLFETTGFYGIYTKEL